MPRHPFPARYIATLKARLRADIVRRQRRMSYTRRITARFSEIATAIDRAPLSPTAKLAALATAHTTARRGILFLLSHAT